MTTHDDTTIEESPMPPVDETSQEAEENTFSAEPEDGVESPAAEVIPDETITISEETTAEEPDVESEEKPVLIEEEDVLEEAEESEIEPVEMLGRDEMRQAIYALLFVSDRPLSAPRVAEALGDVDKDIVLNMLEELKDEIQSSDTPYVLKEIAGGYQLITKAAYAPFIRRLLQIKKSKRLSKAVLETLAIIAYKQPVTRADVESIRGVSVSYAFDLLQEKRMIKVAGVAELPGRPKLYKTTDEFLIHFGLNTLKELPSLEELRELS